MKKGLLVVSFGTSYPEAVKSCIEATESTISEAMPGYERRRAFSSGMIIKKIEKRDGIRIDSPAEALRRMKEDGFDEVVVQPTHVIHGFETDDLLKVVEDFRSEFASIKIGTPLLKDDADYRLVVEGFKGMNDLSDPGSALVLIGHGTEHPGNSSYPKLEEAFHKAGCGQVLIGTVEGEPGLNEIVEKLKEMSIRKVTIAPFLIVAGDHVNNDIAGDADDSWKSVLTREGFEVECQIKGLGMYAFIRELFAKHAQSVLNT